MLVKHLIFPIYLYHFVITFSESWRPFIFEVTNFTTYSLVDFVEMNSSISDSGSISMSMNVLRNIPNLYATLKIILESSNGNYNLELVNKTINGCDFFRNPKYEPISQVFYKALTKSGTFLNRCPVQKKVYFIKDISLDPESFPPVLPTKGCFADISLMTKSGNNLIPLCGYVIHVQVKQVA